MQHVVAVMTDNMGVVDCEDISVGGEARMDWLTHEVVNVLTLQQRGQRTDGCKGFNGPGRSGHNLESCKQLNKSSGRAAERVA